MKYIKALKRSLFFTAFFFFLLPIYSTNKIRQTDV